MTVTDRARIETRHPSSVADAALVAEVADALAVPRRDPADSFVLHAPLELLARTALLPYVRPTARPLARRRLRMLRAHYEEWGAPVRRPRGEPYPSVTVAATRLLDTIAAGDLDEVDVVAHWLGCAASPRQLRALLADGVVRSLAAAAHAPIFLDQLPRVAPRGELTGELLRGLARELARHPDWQLRWIDATERHDASPDALFAAVADTPALGVPGSTFIHPVMSAVDGSGVAAAQLAAATGGTDIALRARALLRAAAWSMLLEGDHVPYGWTHALTMPQAVLGVASALGDPSVGLAIAATHLVGFRAALATRLLVPTPPDDPGIPLAVALDEAPEVAAGAAWHAALVGPRDVVVELATRAATAHDAHHVKYVLACLDAAAADRAHRPLFLAAAAALSAWWERHPDADDPLRDATADRQSERGRIPNTG